jgi:hypothetical protein
MNFPFGATLWVYEQQKTYLRNIYQHACHNEAMETELHAMKIICELIQKGSPYMSDLRPSCFCGNIIWTEWESFALGIGWLIIAIARATFPIFLTCSQTE